MSTHNKLKYRNVLIFMFDKRLAYSYIKVNYSIFEQLYTNFLCCTFVRRRQHLWAWCPLNGLY